MISSAVRTCALAGNPEVPAYVTSFGNLSDLQRDAVLIKLGYRPYYNAAFANLETHNTINGIPSTQPWRPNWYGPAVSTDVVASWQASNNTSNSVGVGYDGVQRGSVSYTAGVSGTAFSFNGASGNAVLVPNDNQITDGGFEFEQLAATAYQYAPSGTPWTFSPGSAGLAASGSAFDNGTSPSGSQVAFLQASGRVSGGFDLERAGNYLLTFSAKGRWAGYINPIQVIVDNVVVQTITPAGVGAYNAVSINLPNMTAGDHSIAFQGTGPNGNYTSFIDSVSLSPRITSGTVDAWIKTTDTSLDYHGIVVKQGALDCTLRAASWSL